mmetsp:Transcript_29709/g.88153  ORF Transcript_29709/g.88153 Transcript_29709/m.88153 type:complete len:216 (+) Transcript_29709:554-1201(+)
MAGVVIVTLLKQAHQCTNLFFPSLGNHLLFLFFFLLLLLLFLAADPAHNYGQRFATTTHPAKLFFGRSFGGHRLFPLSFLFPSTSGGRLLPTLPATRVGRCRELVPGDAPDHRSGGRGGSGFDAVAAAGGLPGGGLRRSIVVEPVEVVEEHPLELDPISGLVLFALFALSIVVVVPPRIDEARIALFVVLAAVPPIVAADALEVRRAALELDVTS